MTFDGDWEFYVGYSVTSNEYYLALNNGNVVKSRAIHRLIPSVRWCSKSVLATEGVPGRLTVHRGEEEPDVEGFQNPHENKDASERSRLDEEMVIGEELHACLFGKKEFWLP